MSEINAAFCRSCNEVQSVTSYQPGTPCPTCGYSLNLYSLSWLPGAKSNTGETMPEDTQKSTGEPAMSSNEHPSVSGDDGEEIDRLKAETERLKSSLEFWQQRENEYLAENDRLKAERDAYRAVLEGAGYKELDRLATESVDRARFVGQCVAAITTGIKIERENVTRENARLRFAVLFAFGWACAERKETRQ